MRPNDTTEASGHFDLIETAMEFLDERAKAHIVKQFLRGQVREVIRQRFRDDSDVLFSQIAEKLQRKMDAEGASKFHHTLLDKTGIDARKPMFSPGQYAVDRLEDIGKLAQFYRNNSPEKKGRV